MKFRCQICKEIIGTVDVMNISLPIQGNMFHPKDDKHGYPPPFHPMITWRDMKCPYCNNRPFIYEDEMMGEDKNIYKFATFIIHNQGKFIDENGKVIKVEEGKTDGEATGEPPTEVRPDAPTHEQEAEGDTVPTTDAPAEAPAEPDRPQDLEQVFEDMIKDGVIEQRGSWYSYQGNSYRKDDLMKELFEVEI